MATCAETIRTRSTGVVPIRFFMLIYKLTPVAYCKTVQRRGGELWRFNYFNTTHIGRVSPHE